jgi:hypothetical protein
MGLESCQFKTSRMMVPELCRVPDYNIYMQAWCQSDTIDVPYSDYTITKDKAALLVVLIDLLIGLILVLSFEFLRFF